MNSFYSTDELNTIGFKSLGENILISKKASIYSPQKISIGNNVRIDDFCILSGKISISNYVHIAAFSCLFGGKAGIDMCDFSTISSKTSVYAVSDDYSGGYLTNPMIPDKYRNVTNEKVYIGKHVIVGSGSVILPGAMMEEGCSFGALSLITKKYSGWNVYVGIPAKKLKTRSKNLLRLEEKLI